MPATPIGYPVSRLAIKDELHFTDCFTVSRPQSWATCRSARRRCHRADPLLQDPLGGVMRVPRPHGKTSLARTLSVTGGVLGLGLVLQYAWFADLSLETRSAPSIVHALLSPLVVISLAVAVIIY